MNSETIDTFRRPVQEDVNQTLALGEVLARSGYFTDTREAAQAAVKVMAGRELGIGPITAMMHLHMIKNRIVLDAILIAALILRSGRYHYAIKHHDDQRCILEFTVNGVSIGVSSFTMEDARRAGLAGGDNWRKYPRNMLFARAISNGARWFCPDVFNGAIYVPEELDAGAPIDVSVMPPVEVTYGPAQPALPPPSPKSKPKGKRNEQGVHATGDPATDKETPNKEHAHVARLIADTDTDIAKILAHYQIPALDHLTREQCDEAVTILTARLNSGKTAS